MTRHRLRCAVYTRKSTDEGLDQGFNSLDAQREACEAYVASQRHEGWVLAKARFDDGGVSGGTLERPALTRLLGEIEAGRVGMVVVYKIDRLTRSLADFAKLVERFDAAGCAFVSVTQGFDTASSMGRLTLNVLLSFAQFEREVTAERIRDKIAASKRKGLWMGGPPPLGYDPHPDPTVRELVPNPEEAETVRALFELYDAHGSLVAVEREAARLGLRSKRRAYASGRRLGGGPLSRGQIHKLLVNPVHVGRVRHKDRVWPGRHPAIVDEALWTRVQEKLQADARRRRGSRSGSEATAPLAGRLRDETGDRLTPTHATRRGRRFRYYVSNRLIAGGPDPAGWRLPAPALERTVAGVVADRLEAAAAGHAILAAPDLARGEAVAVATRDLSGRLRAGAPDALRALLRSGTLRRDRLELVLDAAALAEALGLAAEDLAPGLATISAPLRLRRRGVEARLVVGDPVLTPDPVLLRALAEAHRWTAALKAGTPLAEVAREAGRTEARIRVLARLAFLSPAIQRAILDGTQPPELTLERLVRGEIPLDWDDQETLLG